MATARRIEYMRLDDIKPAPRNPKQHDRAAIGASVDRFGLSEVPLLDERTGRLVAGHGRLEDILARAERGDEPPDGVRVARDGQWTMPVVRGWASRSDAEAEAYLVASNRLTERGGWDDSALASLLSDLAAADAALLEVTGYDPDDLTRLIEAGQPPDLSGFKSLDDVAAGAGASVGDAGTVECPECGHTFTP